ncbi:unnamed protein product [Rhizoctonia solani]|uniref:Uncharacterized protein n=1 Tax=Rhizoctonia solani TaxID=456999 RepID=A0A8H3A343_9AGAM|nr:unnamed protein product [Rhizoctonia solani]
MMGVPLKPNHHFSMHYREFFTRFGPAYAWWLFSYERFNGLLEKVKLNNKSGDISTSLMRFWVRLHRLYEMVENLSDNITHEEKVAVSKLCYTEPGRGTLLAQAAGLSNNEFAIRTPRHLRKINLQAIDIDVYPAALRFAQDTWPHLDLKHERSDTPGGMLFLSHRVAEIMDFIYKSGVRYGSTSSQRTKNDRYIIARFCNGHLAACRIEFIFRLTVGTEKPELAIAVRRFITSNEIPEMPWDLHTGDLGYFVAPADQLGVIEFIKPEQISSPLGICSVPVSNGQNIWIGVSYDRTGEEMQNEPGLFDEIGDEDGELLT